MIGIQLEGFLETKVLMLQVDHLSSLEDAHKNCRSIRLPPISHIALVFLK